MSPSTRVLVTGAGGQVGIDLVDVLGARIPLGADGSFNPDGQSIREGEFEVVALSRRDLDVTNRDAVIGSLRNERPDVIVHLAAYTAVDKAEDDMEECYAVNARGTETMSLGARDVGAHLITISTDYVFNGEKGAPYVETDRPNPINVYGASKLEGEELCLAGDTIVRTSWVMGVRGKNVVHVIAERALGGEGVRFVDDQMGTVTAASDLSRSLVTLIRERPGGLWHVANSGVTTWFDIAAHVGTLLGRPEGFATPIQTGDLSPAPLASRPPRSDLDTSKFAERWAALPAWRDAVERLVRDRSRREATQ